MMGSRVLVVDDDLLVLEVVAFMLEELGCEPLRARSGTKALGTIANDQTIDVLITDINMSSSTTNTRRPIIANASLLQAVPGERCHKSRFDTALGGDIRRAYSSRNSGAPFKD